MTSSESLCESCRHLREVVSGIRIIGGDGKPAIELSLMDGYFEMALPQGFFEGNRNWLILNWIDFYRN